MLPVVVMTLEVVEEFAGSPVETENVVTWEVVTELEDIAT